MKNNTETILDFLKSNMGKKFATKQVASYIGENYSTVRKNLGIIVKKTPFIHVEKISATNYYWYAEEDDLPSSIKPKKEIKKTRSKSKKKLLTNYYNSILPKIHSNTKLTDKELSIYKTLFPKSSDWKIHSIHLSMPNILDRIHYNKALSNPNYKASKIKMIRKISFDYGLSTIFISKKSHTLEITFHVLDKHPLFKHGISYIHFFEGWFEFIQQLIIHELGISLKKYLGNLKITQFHVNYDSLSLFKSFPAQSMLSLDYFSDFLYQIYPKDFNILREEIQYLPKKEDAPFTLSELRDFKNTMNENPLIPFQISQMRNDYKKNFEKINKTNHLFLGSLKNIQQLQMTLGDKINQYETINNSSNSQISSNILLLKKDIISTFTQIDSVLEQHIKQQQKFYEYFNRYLGENSVIQTKSFELHQELVSQMTTQTIKQNEINQNLSNILSKLTDKPSIWKRIVSFFTRKKQKI